MNRKTTRSLTHWGLYDFHVADNKLVDVTPVSSDPDPSPLGRNLIKGNEASRIRSPAVRRGYLEGRSDSTRGDDAFVDVSWDVALKLTAKALTDTIRLHGNEAIYGGSYGWASAGRFHHAQSQLHRFLTCIGGYTQSVNAYSFAAAEVILPHLIGRYEQLLKAPSSWPTIAKHTQLMVCFGGMPLRNAQITNGGMSRHVQRQYMRDASDAGVRFVNISPSRADCADFLDAQWLALRPGTDVALMLALAHEIHRLGAHDTRFLAQYCNGFEPFENYLTGDDDGTPKSPEWAANICGIDADSISELARQMTRQRTMISLSWSLSRHEHGEQPYWMGITLAAMLGQIGLPGGGIGLGYGVENKVGKNVSGKYIGHLARGRNPVDKAIPVARISDMLLNPGGAYIYDGADYTFPDIKLIYWAGGNPFHHHQDLNRLKRAWQKPETVICQELVWNTTAMHSDIVLPAASFLERNDIGGAPNEDLLAAMPAALLPMGEAKTDYEILSALAAQMGVAAAFTEGKTETQWLESLYMATANANPGMPKFEEFWQTGIHNFPDSRPHTLYESFRQDPKANPLATASGLINLASDSLGHARWCEPSEWLGNADTHRFHLLSHQPATRLHSQLDLGEISQQGRIAGVEPLLIHPLDAQACGVTEGEKVLVFNDRGGFYAGIQCSEDLLRGVLHIATGAWWEPDEKGYCTNGNPNAVTLDIGTSTIAQGPSALTCLVSIKAIS